MAGILGGSGYVAAAPFVPAAVLRPNQSMFDRELNQSISLSRGMGAAIELLICNAKSSREAHLEGALPPISDAFRRLPWLRNACREWPPSAARTSSPPMRPSTVEWVKVRIPVIAYVLDNGHHVPVSQDAVAIYSNRGNFNARYGADVPPYTSRMDGIARSKSGTG